MHPIYIWFMTRADGQGFLIHIQWRDDLHALAGAAGATAAGPENWLISSASQKRKEFRGGGGGRSDIEKIVRKEGVGRSVELTE